MCESADNFRNASLKASDFSYVCIIVVLTLPGGSGLEIVRQLKESHLDSGIIIISARNALDDKITGLEVGLRRRLQVCLPRRSGR